MTARNSAAPAWIARMFATFAVYARIVRLLGPRRGQTLGMMACVVLSTGFGLILPWLLAWVVDLGIRHGNTGQLALAAAAILATSSLRGLFAYGQGYLSQAVSQWLSYDLRDRLYDHLQQLSFSFHDESETGQLMSRMTVDIEAVRNFIVLGLTRAVLALVTFGTVTIILLRLDWQLALVTLICVPILAVLSMTVARRLHPLWTSVQQETGTLGSIMQESLAGVRVVKAFAREEHEIAKFDAKNKEVRALSLEAMRISAWNQPLMVFVLNIVTVAVVWLGGQGVIGHRLSLGTLVAVTQYVLLLGSPVRTFGFMMNWFTRGLSSGERLFEVLDTKPAIVDSPTARAVPSLRGHVRFEHVYFAYGDGPPVLEDVSIEAAPGKVVALLGATGSGKSTVLHLLPRFYDVTAGRITIDGQDVREMTLASLRGTIGLVLQDVFLFNATLWENIAYGVAGATDEQVRAAAAAARVDEFVRGMPDGYQTLVGERGVTLSGGQKQRVAIARTLLRDPRILVLDDATSSVDMETEYLIQQALEVLMRGRTTFVVASRLRTVKNADQIIVLDQGRVIERGTHEKLLARHGLYARLYNVQMREQDDYEQQAVAAKTQRRGRAG
jgi:ABC-type multidrug transport system fused ATPase/permease subunit